MRRLALLIAAALVIPARVAAQPAPPPNEAPSPPPEKSPAPDAPSAPDGGPPPAVEERAPPEASDAGPPPPPPVPAVPVAPAPKETPPAPAAPAPPPEPEVVVGGTRINRAAGSAHVIGRQQLERFRYDDPHTVLLQVPGVYVRQEDGVGLRPNIGIRGGNPDRSKKLTLMEDGILFGPAPYSAPAAYFFPLTARMVQVRVVKGPAAVAFGPQTVGGAVDFITRPIPVAPSGAVDLALGEYGYNKVHAHFGASTEQFGFLLETVRLQNTGFKELPDASADTGATRSEWMAKASYLVDPTAAVRNELGFKLLYSEETSNETYLGLTDADLRRDPYQRYAASALDQMKNHRIGFVLSHEVEVPRHNVKVTTALYRNDYSRIWRKLNRFGGASIASVLAQPDDPANRELVRVLRGEVDSATGVDSLYVGPNDRTFVSQGLQTRIDFRKRTGAFDHVVEAGLRLHHDSIERRHSEDEFLMAGGVLVPAGTPTIVTAANYEKSHALAFHALYALSVGRLTVTPGARMELIASDSTDRMTGATSDAFVPAFMPGIGAYYGLTNALGVLAGVYRGFSPPPPGSGVPPEYSVNYEGGARLSAGASRVEVIGFYNDYSNLTDICTFSSSCVNGLDQQFSGGRARIYGVEAYARHDLPVGALRIPMMAAYTLTGSRFRDTFDSPDPLYGSVVAGDELPYVPRHQVSLSLGVDSDRAGASAAGYYVSPMREEAGSEPLEDAMSTDPQAWLDLGAYVKPLKALSVYANLRNATGAANIVGRRPFGARPNAPRWLQVGARLTF